MYLIVFQEVQRGSKVRIKGFRRDLSPEREYTVESVQEHLYWDHEGHNPFGKDILRHPFRCEGCGNVIVSQHITLEGLQGRFSSEDFELQRTCTVPEAPLKSIFERLRKRPRASA